MMTSRERFLAATRLEEPDRVPISDVGVSPSVVERSIGRRLSSEAEWARAQAEMGFDMIVSRHRLLGHGQNILGETPPGWEPEWIDDRTYIGEWGEIRKVASNMESPVDGIIRNEDDLEDFDIPDPHKDGRADPVEEAVNALGEDTPVFALIHDAFELPWMMRGRIERLVTDYYRNPRLAERLTEISTDFNIEMAKILLDAGATGIVTGDDYAFSSGPFMTPEHFERFIYPYLRKLVRVVHRRGAPFLKHTDGQIWPIMEPIIESKPDILNPIESEAGMDLGEVKNRLGHRIALMGNVDCGPILHYGTREQVAEDVRRCVRDGAAEGGFILSSSNTIYDGCRPENVKAMIEYTHRIGRYR